LVARLQELAGELLEQRVDREPGEEAHGFLVLLVMEPRDDLLEVVRSRGRLVAAQGVRYPEARLVMAELLGDEVGDVLLDLEGLVLEERLAQALGAVWRRPVLHPGTQAPPFRARGTHLRWQVRLAQVAVVDVRGRIPGKLARLLAQAPDFRILDAGNH